jgi:hypothetical protein
MIIDYFDIVRISIIPFETDSPLLVDPDAVLAFSIPLQRFEPVSGRNI